MSAKREDFFKSDPIPPKFDPHGLRDRDRGLTRDREKSYTSSSSDRGAGDNHKYDTSSSDKAKEIEGYVGFANLPNQVYRKSVKKGFEFTLMVVGE